MKRIIKIALLIAIIGNTAASAKTARERRKDKDKGNLISQEYPFKPENKNIPSFIQKKRFQMSLNKDEYRNIEEKMDNFTKIMNSTLGLEILQRPSIKPIKTIDTLYIHPRYISTIILPEGSRITFAKPSFENSDKVTFDQNVLNIRPDRNFLNGNIVIYYTKDQENYHLNIILKNYRTAECKVDENKKEFICENSGFGLVYKYVEKNTNDDVDILFAYVDLVGKDMKELHKQGFGKVIYKNELYYIIEDKKFGTIFYRGGKYRVTTKML